MRIYLLLTLCAAIWSGNFIIGRFVRFELDPIELAFFRWLGVCLLFIPSFIKHRVDILDTLKNHFWYMLSVSFLGITCFNTFLYVGLQYTMATNALLLNSSIPIIIILFSVVLLKTEVTKKQFTGITLSMFGVVYFALKGSFANLIALEFNRGDIWVFSGALMWGLYSTLLKQRPQGIKAFLPITVLLGTMMLAPAFFWQGHQLSDIFLLSRNAALSVLYTVVFASIVGFYLWNKGIAVIGAERTGQFIHLIPPFGVILAYIFLDERLHLYHITGFILIGFGIWLSLSKGKSKVEEAKREPKELDEKLSS